ncbi:MAG: hypothetical protein QJR02_05290 [Sinobacteraceae bacterium]|nr:hypothetical protein [Nevskiaceae bacterium]
MTGPADPLRLPRRLALRLLHEAQARGGTPLVGVVAGEGGPRTFLPLEQDGDLALALARLRRDGLRPWAVFLYRPQWSQAPTAEDFGLEAALPRLTASLATKGVLQLRAWVCENGRVRERELHLED